MSHLFYKAGHTSALIKLGVDIPNPRHARIFSPEDTAAVQKALADAGVQSPAASAAPAVGKPRLGSGTALKPQLGTPPAPVRRARQNAVIMSADDSRAAIQKALQGASAEAKPSMLKRLGNLVGKIR